MPTLSNIGELATIKRLAEYITIGDGVKTGIGDDCAVISIGGNADDLLLTSDAVIESIHFTKGTPAGLFGRKAINRVISDIAAMGGRPGWVLINLVAPPETDAVLLDDLYKELASIAEMQNISIVGGDVAKGACIEIHIFGVGTISPGKAILRSGARVNDLIFVTGNLGGSIKGKHLNFEPRVKEGQFLVDHANAMIDLSDGLSTDLQHILIASNCGAKVYEKEIPISAEAINLNDDLAPLQHAVSDGEDFELLFTIPPDKEQVFTRTWNQQFSLPCTLIGHITDNTGVAEYIAEDGSIVEHKNLGFDHFE